jgi:TRAP-type C4-dicarboxylate transport system substrate-binding protein
MSIRRTAVVVTVAAIVASSFALARLATASTTTTNARVVLQMANGYADLSYEPTVAYFVRRVAELSRGALRVQVVSEWGNSSPGFEQRIVRDLAGGKADLGWVGTRIFDTLGVNSFQALTAPLLIDSYPLERAVLASPIPKQMLAGLRSLGLTGLAVLADALRKPIAVKKPLLAPADWRDITFAAFRSRSQAAAIRALGAHPSEAWSDALANGLDSGRIEGFEKNLLVYRITGLARSARYVTANVNLWPQTAALIANQARLARLTKLQQDWLRKAAAQASARSTSLTDGDQSLVAPLCKAGARFANATQDDLAALRKSFGPVYAALTRDRETRSYVTRIEQLKRSTPAGRRLAFPARCAAHAPPS